MINHLKKKFVAGAQDEGELRQRYGLFSNIVGLVLNLIIALAKIVGGTLANSVSVTADGINNLTDTFSNFIGLFSFYISSRPPDREHPYGHARTEYLASSVIALVILYVGGTFLWESFQGILKPHAIDATWITFGSLILSIVVKLWMYGFYTKIGKDIDSELILATAVDARNDVLMTAMIVVSTLIMKLTGVHIDGWMGLVISLIILYSGWEILSGTIDQLLGEGPAKHKVREIYDFIMSYDGVIGVHNLSVYDYGPGVHFLTVHVEVDARGDLLELHTLVDGIEKDLERIHGYQTTIHMDPLDIHDPKTQEKMAMVREVLDEIDPQLGFHDFRVVKGYRGMNLVFDVLVPLEYKLTHGEIEERIVEGVRRRQPNDYVNINFDLDYVGELDL